MVHRDTFPTFPTRVQYGNYLHGYQIAMGIPMQTSATVTHAIKNDDGGWEVGVRTHDNPYHNLVSRGEGGLRDCLLVFAGNG